MNSRFKLLSLMLILLMIPSVGGAQIVSGPGQSGTTNIPLFGQNRQTGRPHMPPYDIHLTCDYDSEGNLVIVFDEPEGMAQVSIEDDLGEVVFADLFNSCFRYFSNPRLGNYTYLITRVFRTMFLKTEFKNT